MIEKKNFLGLTDIWVDKNVGSQRIKMGECRVMSVGEGGRGEGISLCVKFETSRMLSSGIFWWGYCSCCDSGKIKSLLVPKLKLGLWTGV